jgi:hypothetical protein
MGGNKAVIGKHSIGSLAQASGKSRVTAKYVARSAGFPEGREDLSVVLALSCGMLIGHLRRSALTLWSTRADILSRPGTDYGR